jgi:uracil-DNA glycosylase family 4
VIGEAPGREEDAQGVPFVGRAGELLNEALSRAGLRREEVFVTNVVCCRPPDNRTPTYEEVSACGDHLQDQLAAVQPRVLLLLGASALRAFYPDEGITSARGRPRIWPGTGWIMIPTWHPAAVLRDPSKRPEFEAHLLMAAAWCRAAEQIHTALLLAEESLVGRIVPSHGEFWSAQDRLLRDLAANLLQSEWCAIGGKFGLGKAGDEEMPWWAEIVFLWLAFVFGFLVSALLREPTPKESLLLPVYWNGVRTEYQAYLVDKWLYVNARVFERFVRGLSVHLRSRDGKDCADIYLDSQRSAGT